jgi:hypothetical protein
VVVVAAPAFGSAEDEQFADEKAFLLKQIEQLPSASS